MHLLQSYSILVCSYAAMTVMTLSPMLTRRALQLAALHTLRHIVAISTASHRHQPDDHARDVQDDRKLGAKF